MPSPAHFYHLPADFKDKVFFIFSMVFADPVPCFYHIAEWRFAFPQSEYTGGKHVVVYYLNYQILKRKTLKIRMKDILVLPVTIYL